MVEKVFPDFRDHLSAIKRESKNPRVAAVNFKRLILMTRVVFGEIRV
jgi:hypothetical protein